VPAVERLGYLAGEHEVGVGVLLGQMQVRHSGPPRKTEPDR
jgi:hypothetical protein